MPNLNDTISNIVFGDSVKVSRTITGVPNARTVALAFFTVKVKVTGQDTNDELKIVQKIVTTSLSSGGQITDPGTGAEPDREATVEFFLHPEDTSLFEEGKSYVFDVQVKFDNNDINTPFKGTLTGQYGVTNKTSA